MSRFLLTAVSFALIAASAPACAQDPSRTAAAAQAQVDANPYDGRRWRALADALSGADRCAEAAPAYEQALALGVDGAPWSLRDTTVALARCLAITGDLDGALARLSVAQGPLGFSDFAALDADPALASLVEDPRYQRLAGRIDRAALDRDAGWRSDLAYFDELMRRRHPNPFHTVSEADWADAVARLDAAIPDLSDLEIVAEFMRLAGLIRDGHTAVYPPFAGEGAFHMLPITLYAFPDGWRVLAAEPDYADLVGGRVLAVNGTPMAEVADAIAAFVAYDNPMTSKWLGGVALQFSEAMAAAAGGGDPLAPVLTVETPGGAELTRALGAGPITRNPMAPWPPADWTAIDDGAPTPAWLARTEEPFWFEDRPEDGFVYAQINQIRDGETETLAAFAARLGATLDATDARALVLDLRHNNGGNGTLNWALVREIVRRPAFDRDGGFYVIVGRRTFSAAMLLASMLDELTHATFVGEPTGSAPNIYAEETGFTLPYRGLTGSISSLYYQKGYSSADVRPWIAPDIAAELTAADLAAGRDPALEAIRAALSSAANPVR